jgi:hypothetical protein
MALGPIVFPKLIELCSFQSERMEVGMQELMPMLVPPDDIGTYLFRNSLVETVIVVLWPDR